MVRTYAFAKPSRPTIENLPVGMRGPPWIDLQQIIAYPTGVDMDVKMRDLLIRTGTRGMPDAEPVTWKHAIDCPRHFYGHAHQGGAGWMIQRSDVRDVPTRHHQHMTGMKLTHVENG
jgi:hypothetical protein